MECQICQIAWREANVEPKRQRLEVLATSWNANALSIFYLHGPIQYILKFKTDEIKRIFINI